MLILEFPYYKGDSHLDHQGGFIIRFEEREHYNWTKFCCFFAIIQTNSSERDYCVCVPWTAAVSLWCVEVTAAVGSWERCLCMRNCTSPKPSSEHSALCCGPSRTNTHPPTHTKKTLFNSVLYRRLWFLLYKNRYSGNVWCLLEVEKFHLAVCACGQ